MCYARLAGRRYVRSSLGLYLPECFLASNVNDLSLNRTVAYQALYGLSPFEGIEERCQVERRTNLYRSTGLFVVLSSYNQVVRVTKGSEQ
jgi:hypothetical protein